MLLIKMKCKGERFNRGGEGEGGMREGGRQEQRASKNRIRQVCAYKEQEEKTRKSDSAGSHFSGCDSNRIESR